MSKLNLLIFAVGVLIAIYGGYSLIADGGGTGFIFVFGGIVITAIAAGLIGKQHSEGS